MSGGSQEKRKKRERRGMRYDGEVEVGDEVGKNEWLSCKAVTAGDKG